MKEQDVPQDIDSFKNRDQVKKVMYATNDEGTFIAKQSAGWDVEIEATKLAWREVEDAIAIVKNKVQKGQLSPIAYYMELRIMSLKLLAQYVGKWQWQVKRHMKPSVFNTLSQSLLIKYADIFQIPLEALLDINKFQKIG